MTVSLKTIAQEVGVSREAVSHILNGRAHKVSSATRDAVLAALKRYDYQPNGLVQALRSKRTHTVGMIVPDVQVSVFPEIVSAVESEAEKFGYQVLITQSHSSSENVKKQVALFRQKRVDGLAIYPINSEEQAELYPRLMAAGVPFVVFFRLVKDLQLPLVINDNREVGRLATQHLLDLGHRRIVFLRGYPSTFDARDREEGYCHALEDAGIEIDPALIAGNNYTLQSGQMAMEEILSRGVPFTGIVAVSDLTAIGAIQKLWQTRLRVPEDVSVVGCGNLDVGQFFNPPLTTIDQKPEDVGRTCMRMLLERIDNIHAPIRQEIITPELIVRQSTVRCNL